MQLKVDELPQEGRFLQFHETPAWFFSMMHSMEEPGEIFLTQPVNVDLELVPQKDRVVLNGRLQTAVGILCSRCLQNFVLELDETFGLVLERPLSPDAPEELNLHPRDLDTEFYDGVTIDVDLIVAEQIFLALPQKPLCQPHCRGLCPGCGADLNYESCRCEKRETGSPFDVLLSLKIER